MTLTPGNWWILPILAWGLRLGISLQQDLPKKNQMKTRRKEKGTFKSVRVPWKTACLASMEVEGSQGNLQNQLHGVFVRWGSGGRMNTAFFLGLCDAWPWKGHLLGPTRKKSLAMLCFVLTSQSMKGCSVAPDSVWLRETGNLVRTITTSSLVRFESRMVKR